MGITWAKKKKLRFTGSAAIHSQSMLFFLSLQASALLLRPEQSDLAALLWISLFIHSD